MVKNVVFDFGGIIILLDQTEAIRRFKQLGIANIEEYLNIYGQKGVFKQLEIGEVSADEFSRILAKMAQEQSGAFEGVVNPAFTFEEMKYAWMGYVKKIPIERFGYLEKLKESYNVCLLSNINPYLMDWARSSEFTPDGHSLDDYFDEFYLSYLMMDYKPSETIFQKMLDEGGMKPEETIFLDDAPRNCETAQKLGIHTILVGEDEDWRPKLDKMLSELNKK